MKTGDMKVAVDNENAKIEKKGYPGESEREPGHEIVWNDVGGNQKGLALMNEDLRNHEEHVGKEREEWGIRVQWEARSRPQPNRDMKPAEPEAVSPWQQMFACRY